MSSEASLQSSRASLLRAGPLRASLEHRLSVSPIFGRKIAPADSVQFVLLWTSVSPVRSTTPSLLVSALMSGVTAPLTTAHDSASPTCYLSDHFRTMSWGEQDEGRSYQRG